MFIACDIKDKKRDKFYFYLMYRLFIGEAFLIPDKVSEFESIFIPFLENKMKQRKHYRYYFGKFFEMFDFNSYDYITPEEMSRKGKNVADYNGALNRVSGSIRHQLNIGLFEECLIYDEYSNYYARRKQHQLKPYILTRDEHKCVRCSDTNLLEIHHIQPVSQYGKSTENNLVTLCNKCHKEVHKIKDKKFLVG